MKFTWEDLPGKQKSQWRGIKGLNVSQINKGLKLPVSFKVIHTCDYFQNVGLATHFMATFRMWVLLHTSKMGFTNKVLSMAEP